MLAVMSQIPRRSLQARYFNLTRRGQTLVEYALILAFISIVAILVLQSLGTKTKQIYTNINSRMDTAMSSS
jgi:Flp pilus assembly pilin Flp